MKAGDWALGDQHTVPKWDASAGRNRHAIIQKGELYSLAEWVDRKIVSKFASATERSNIRPEGLPGEVSWVGDGTAAARGLDVYSGDHGYLRIPTVIVSTDTAPVGLTNHPDGTLWIQVQS